MRRPACKQACGTLLALVAVLGGCAGEDSVGDATRQRAPSGDDDATHLAVPAAKKACAAGFPASPWPTTPLYTAGIASADFNGDGHVDLVETSETGAAILLGQGNGRFEPAHFIAPGYKWSVVRAADFDGDGLEDLVVLETPSPYYSQVGILRGQGSGSFDAPVTIQVPYSYDVEVADFNGDGRPDILVGGIGFEVLPNAGESFGTALPVATYYQGMVTGKQAGVADFNGDGKLDIVVADAASNSWVELGYGNGTFEGPTELVDNQQTVMTAGDLNGDGKPDVLALSTVALEVVPALNSGNGTFALGKAVPYAGPGIATRLHLADVDGDGKLDFIVGHELHFGRGDGTFGAPVDLVGQYAVNATVNDLNGDGIPDLALATSGNYTSVLLGGRRRTFGPLPEVSSVGGMASALVTADFDGDGRSDVAVARADAAAVEVLLSTAGGSLGAAKSFAVKGKPEAIATGDLDGDGVPDLVTSRSASPELSVLLGRRAGGFHPAATVNAGTSPSALAIADLNGDGHADLVVTTGASEVRVLLGVGDGTFGAPVSYPVSDAFGQAVVVGDFDADGHADLGIAAGALGSCTVQQPALDVLLGSGSGTFGASTRIALPGTGSQALGLTLGDFDKDGRPDILGVWSNCLNFEPVVYLFTGVAGGGFTTAQIDATDSYAAGLASGDFNRDGALDFVTMGVRGPGPRTDAMTLFTGGGDGTFSRGGLYPTLPQGLDLLAVGDFDGDGRADVAGASKTGDGVTVILAGACE